MGRLAASWPPLATSWNTRGSHGKPSCAALFTSWLAYGVATKRIRRAGQAELVRQLALKIGLQSIMQLAHRRRNAHQAWADGYVLR